MVELNCPNLYCPRKLRQFIYHREGFLIYKFIKLYSRKKYYLFRSQHHIRQAIKNYKKYIAENKYTILPIIAVNVKALTTGLIKLVQITIHNLQNKKILILGKSSSLFVLPKIIKKNIHTKTFQSDYF